MKKISIIIPVYNTEKYLNKCLDALITQTYTNIELLCINDGSQDKSLGILQNYAQKDERIKVFDQPNSGPAKARNQGLKAATGQYIMFCDADDWYAPQMCEEMLTAITSYDVDLVMCDCNLIECEEDPDPERCPETDYFLNLFGYYQLTHEHMIEVKGLLWNKIFKKELIDQYGISFPDGFEHDDVSFVEQYVCCARYFFGLDQKLYWHLIHANSIVAKMIGNDSKILQSLDAIKHTFFFLQKNQLFTEKNFYYYFKLLYFRMIWVFENCGSSENKMLAIEKTRTILIAFDLDLFHEDYCIGALKKIKQKNYSAFLEERQLSPLAEHHLVKRPPPSNQAHQKDSEHQKGGGNKKNKKENKGKTMLNILKAYLFWPYYLYKIYKKL